jgi:hypothetical protein
MNKAIKIAGCIWLALLLSGFSNIYSQQTIGDTDIEVYTLTGNVSFQGHGYTTTQDLNRREPLGALTTANFDYSFLGFQSGMDLRYSTDDNRFRQSMNRFSFYGSYKWARLSAGDVNPSYSQYSLRGTMVRGGELSLTPGDFSFEVTAGRTNRLTSSGNGNVPRSFEYERWIYAATIGYGRQNRSHFRLTALYGKDDTESLPDTTGMNLPSTQALAPPAENLAVTPKFQVLLFDDMFRLGAETTFSAYTRDTDSPVIEAADSELPGFVASVFSPRNSTRLSFAGLAETELDVDPFNLMVSYERIQPGFESMGLRQIRDDQQVITIRPAVHFLNRRINLDATYTMTEDNLLDSRISTQKNDNLALNSSFQITEAIRLGAGYSRYVSNTVSDDEFSGGHRQLSQVIQLTPSVSWISGGTSYNVTVAGVYQTLESRFPGADGFMFNESSTITSTLSYNMALPTGITVNGSANLVLGEAPGSEFTTYGLNAGVGYSFMDQKLNVSANTGFTLNEFERLNGFEDSVTRNMQLNGNATATYSITSMTSLQLNLRLLNNNIMEGDGSGFSEMEGRLQFRQRF